MYARLRFSRSVVSIVASIVGDCVDLSSLDPPILYIWGARSQVPIQVGYKFDLNSSLEFSLFCVLGVYVHMSFIPAEPPWAS